MDAHPVVRLLTMAKGFALLVLRSLGALLRVRVIAYRFHLLDKNKNIIDKTGRLYVHRFDYVLKY